MEKFDYGEIVHTKRGHTDWIVLTEIKGDPRPPRYLCLCPTSYIPIICRYRGEILSKQNYYLKTKRKIYDKVKALNCYDGKWANYLINNPISDLYFKLKICSSQKALTEKINIWKKLKDKSVTSVSICVQDTKCSTVESILIEAFNDIFEEEPEVIELNFGGIIYEGGLDSIWIDKATTRSWSQKRGESLQIIDSNEYYDPDMENEYLANKAYDSDNNGSNITDGQINGDWEGIKPHLGY